MDNVNCDFEYSCKPILYNIYFPHLFCSTLWNTFWRNNNTGRRHGSNVNSSNIHQFLPESNVLCPVFKVSEGNYCWLIRVTLVVAFGFFSKILRDDRDLQMVLCYSLNVGSMVGIPWGGGCHTSCKRKFVWNPYIQKLNKTQQKCAGVITVGNSGVYSDLVTSVRRFHIYESGYIWWIYCWDYVPLVSTKLLLRGAGAPTRDLTHALYCAWS